MLRRLTLFFTMVLVALTAGRAFWAWLGENPADLSGATYVEFFQALDRKIAIPIAVTGIGATLLAGISAVLFRRERLVRNLLLATCACCLVASLVTILVNVPINLQIATWNPAALPDNYRDFLNRWWRWHQVRFVALVTGMSFLFAAVLVRK
jgi:uncharacterized membrane protein